MMDCRFKGMKEIGYKCIACVWLYTIETKLHRHQDLVRVVPYLSFHMNENKAVRDRSTALLERCTVV